MNKLRCMVMAALLAGLAAGLTAEELVWQINYAKSNLIADVRLNGYPVYRPSAAGDNSGVLMIGPWLHKGRNELSVTLLPKPAAADSGGDGADAGSFNEPSFSFGLITFKRSNPADTTNQLFRIKLPLKFNESLSLPWKMDFSIFLDQAPNSQLWDVAPPLALDEATLSEAASLMASLDEALRNRDAERYFGLFHWALVDMYTAYGWMSDGLEAKIKSTLEQVLKGPDFNYAGGDPASLVYELARGSGQRLIAVHGKDGKPAIDAGTFSQDNIFLARIDGRLTVVRN